MNYKHLHFLLFAGFLVLAGVAAPTQARSDSVGEEMGAIRQSIIQGVRDDIQRRISSTL